MTILLPILIAVLGLFLHYAASNPKTQALGMPTYFAGLFVALLQAGPHVVNLLGR